MPPLLHVTPNSANYAMTPAKYPEMIKDLQTNEHSKNFQVSGNEGSVTFQNIDFTWTFDGTANILVTIVAKHGLSEFLPNETIFDELDNQLKTLA